MAVQRKKRVGIGSGVKARAVVYGAEKMTKVSRREVAAWLRGVAREIVKSGPDFASRWEARLYE